MDAELVIMLWLGMEADGNTNKRINMHEKKKLKNPQKHAVMQTYDSIKRKWILKPW